MLKTIFISIFFIFCFLSLKEAWAKEQGGNLDPSTQVQRIASFVEYVAADYKEAVRDDGTIIDESEYAEQKGLLEDAKTQILELKIFDTQYDSEKQQQLLKEVENIQAALSSKKPPAEIQALSRIVRHRLEQDFGLHMEPSEHVSLSQAQPLYQQYCASCHGLTGHADTPMAKVLKPAPVSFFDQDRMANISPALVYHALTFGINGTGMASFDYLAPRDRWNLAFYVLSLRHPSVSSAELSEIAQKAAHLASPKELASKSDAELSKELESLSKDPETQQKFLNYLRAQAFDSIPSANPQKHFAHLEELLKQLLSSATQGDTRQAYELSASAYLDEFEPYEGILRSHNAELVTNLEGLFQELRQQTKQIPPNIDQIQKTITKIHILLEDAEVILNDNAPQTANENSANRHSFWSSFAPVFGITLREGFEVMLLVSFLLAYLRKSGQAKKTHLVHIGWILAMIAGFATYVITYVVLKQAFSGQKRELIEAISTFLALVILLMLTHSILGAKEARQWLGFLGKKLHSLSQNIEGSAKNIFRDLALFGIAFFAVYREMVETILFYRPYLEDGGWAAQQALGLGVLCGVLLIGTVAFFISYTGRRLNPGPVMRVSSIFLGAICVSLAGQGVHALQEAGVLAPYQITIGNLKVPSFPWLGIYATWPGIVLQVVVFLILSVPPILVWRKRKLAAKKLASADVLA